MNFAMFGGDERSVRLCRLLRTDGHQVRVCALEHSLEESLTAPQAALEHAQAVILPLPCQRGGVLTAPLSDLRLPMEELLGLIPAGTPVYAGRAEDIAPLCRALGLPLRDYFAREDLAVCNAALTAEGALALLLQESPRALAGSRVLICGFGRIGRLLALKLRSLGAQISVLARSAADLAWAAALGCRALDMNAPQALGCFDAVVNTIPCPLFRAPQLLAFGDALLLELASPPYGFDPDAARMLGKRLILAPGLPAATAPEAAAEALRDCLYGMMEEET